VCELRMALSPESTLNFIPFLGLRFAKMGAMRVLIVEDEVSLAEGLRDGLVAEGHEVELAHDGDAGFEAATREAFEVIVLDIMLPKRNGYRVCRDLRAAGVSTPVLMLTAKDGDLDEAEALDLGADDFLRKPFSFVVLDARLRALTRRGSSGGFGVGGDRSSQERLLVGEISVDVSARRCHRAAHEVALTGREFDLLVALMRRSPAVVAKAELLNTVWGPDFESDPNIIEVYIGYLRRKLDQPFGKTSVQTVRGHGYRIDA
jgi:two-component system, OmpR family, response regulator